MTELTEYLHSCEAFRALFPSQAKELAEQASINLFAKGEDVFAPGDDSLNVYLLISGSAQISHTDPNGKRAILQVVGAGKLFGQCALIDICTREARCTTTLDSKIVSIPVHAIKKLMIENPRLASDLMMDIGNIMRALAHRLASVLLRPKRQRLLDLLENLAIKDDEGNVSIPEVFSHQELSEMIGASRETVTVILGQLKDDGLVALDGRRLVITSEADKPA
ncbi:MAG: Crp/Fnr family transcriptional regulator [Fuerstiella sp.]